MGALVASYHPVAESFTAAAADSAIAGLRAAGLEPTRIDLAEAGELAQQDLVGIGHLVIAYPTWWGGLPAGLLEIVDDLIGGWVDGSGDRALNPLRSITQLSIVTTHGSSRLINRIQGEPGLVLWKRTLLPLCARRARFDWLALYGMDRAGDDERVEFLDRVRSDLAAAAALVASPR